MPTEPLDALLNRDRSRAAAAELIEAACPLLREIVNQGTRVYSRCEHSASGEADVDAPAFFLYRQVLEMVDGVEVLLDQTCVFPAIPLLRSALEASLELDYLFEEDYERRGLTWIYCHARNRIWGLQIYDPETDRGAELSEMWEREFGEEYNPPTQDADMDEPERLERMIEEDRFSDIEAAYEAIGGHPKWFQLFGGPGNREQLADHLDRGAEYQIMYRYWSSLSHPEHLLVHLREHEGRPIVDPLRHPTRLPNIALNAANLLLKGILRMLDHFRPNEDRTEWYRREVQEPLRRLRNLEVEEIVEVGGRF